MKSLVTGRAGSAMAAEIGAMVATEQLDGLRFDRVADAAALAETVAVEIVVW